MNDATLSALRAAVEARAAAIRSDAAAVRAMSAPVEAALADLRAAIAEQKDALARMEAEAGAALAGMLPTVAAPVPESVQADAAASTVAAFDAALAGLPSSAASPRFAVEILPAHGLNGGADLPGMHAGMSELPDMPKPIPPKRGRAAGHLNGRK